MPSKYKFGDHQRPHFITFATVEWVDALSRPYYKDIIIESLKYCQENKGLVLHAYVIMSNHIHLIASAKSGFSLSDFLRDFKRHTSSKLLKTIEGNSKESRKRWILWIFKSAGAKNGNNKNYQFWRQDNRPIELSTNEMFDQRLEYLHNNPVVEGIVFEADQYVYSSACDYFNSRRGLLDLELL